MDIVSSIDFDRFTLDNRPPTTKKDHGIDVNRQFDVYTTDSITYPADAPPVYQKNRSSHGSAPSLIQASKHELSKPPNLPKFVLKTIPHIPVKPDPIEPCLGRHSEEARRPLQLPRAEPIGTPNPLSRTEPTEHSPMGHIHHDQSTVLCELTGASVDFTQPDDAMPGRMGMVNGASACIIRVTSRKKESSAGQDRVVRSIWVFGAGGKTCIRQKLPEDSNIIPYTIWGNETKVIIRHPTNLRYYRTPDSESPYKKLSSSWVTYTFGSTSLSGEFQSALLPPLCLLRTLSTTRTVRLHNSPWVRTFSPRLQLCGLENLRVFQDLNDPTCLVCMVHYSPNFYPANGEEYIVFRLYPPPRNSIRIREDGEKCVKIKGLDIRGSSASEQMKKGKAPQSQAERLEEEAYGSHSIEKIKIEFESGNEKRQFLELTRELQGLSSW